MIHVATVADNSFRHFELWKKGAKNGHFCRYLLILFEFFFKIPLNRPQQSSILLYKIRKVMKISVHDCSESSIKTLLCFSFQEEFHQTPGIETFGSQ